MEPALYLKFSVPAVRFFGENLVAIKSCLDPKASQVQWDFHHGRPDTEIRKGTFVHPPDQRYPGVKIRITEAMLDVQLYAFFGEHLNS